MTRASFTQRINTGPDVPRLMKKVLRPILRIESGASCRASPASESSVKSCRGSAATRWIKEVNLDAADTDFTEPIVKR